MSLRLKTTLLVDPINYFAIWCIAADSIAQQLPNTRVIILVQSRKQLRQLDLEHIPSEIIFISAHDHRVLGSHYVVTDQQLFIQFFAGTQAGKLDGNVAMRILLRAHTQTRQVNHLLSQLDDSYGLSHIQHKYISPMAHGAGLDYQLRRFGDCHEVTGNLRVSHRQGSTRLDLSMEQRDHRTRRTKYVTETNHGKARFIDSG